MLLPSRNQAVSFHAFVKTDSSPLHATLFTHAWNSAERNGRGGNYGQNIPLKLLINGNTPNQVMIVEMHENERATCKL
jgi:hypothetical protein